MQSDRKLYTCFWPLPFAALDPAAGFCECPAGLDEWVFREGGPLARVRYYP